MKGFIRILGSIAVHEGRSSLITLEVSLDPDDTGVLCGLIEQMLSASHASATLQDPGRNVLKIAIGPKSRIRSRIGLRLEIDLDRVAAEYLCSLLARLAREPEARRWLHADIELDGGSMLVVGSTLFES